VYLKIFVEVCGWAGTLLILAAYALLSNGKMQARSALYQWMNVVGAAGLIINSAWNSAWPSVTLNVVWMALAMFALWQLRRSTSTTDS
jgi:hypothetical protein